MRQKRAIAGALCVLAIAAVIALAVALFRGSFTKTVPLTLISDRAGLVMNPEARVKLNGAQIGKVESVELLHDGRAALHLAIEPKAVDLIPANVTADITSSTVFGAKFVQLTTPSDPSPESIRPGQVLDSQHVTVEINTVFEQLVNVLSKIEPVKLNETLGAFSNALNGRGAKLGQSMADFDGMLATLDPSRPNLQHEIATAPEVFNSYADASPDLVATMDNATRISDTIVDRSSDLDRLLVSAIGLADIGNDVVSANRQPLTDVLHLLVPTTDLTNEYHEAINCGLAGMAPLAMGPPSPVPGTLLLDSFQLGRERYRYPQNLPKVAATGGPRCMGLPDIGANVRPPYLVTDIDANQAQYGNQGILLNSDALKQALFGPIDGPPRNSAQIGHPG
ncbi:MAG: MCE family protein [Mycobacterium sp.]